MIDYAKGIVNMGNPCRLKGVMARAEQGVAITVGFIGGSITQGSLSSTPETCYAYLVYRWWAERYSNVRYINAGIGGTTSQFGVARAEEDLLRHRPDVVFIEFSVNDFCDNHFRETYEGLVRRVLGSGAAAVLIHNVCYDTGVSAEDVHLQIGKHYELGCVSIRSTIYPEIVSGRIPIRQITPDNLHPNDAGHAHIAKLVGFYLDRVSALQDAGTESDFPAPLTANRYEHSTRWQNHNSAPAMQGFVPDEMPQEHILQMFRRGFTAAEPGANITFSVEASVIAVQYRKSVKKPAPIARVVVDGDDSRAFLLDANFQEEWGDSLHIDTVLETGKSAKHTVRIEITDDVKDAAVPFYLAAVIASR